MPKTAKKRATKTVKKRKVALQNITRCHPSLTSKEKCLPEHIYSDISKSIGVSDAELYTKTGCNPGEDHCLLDHSSLDDKQKKDLRTQYLRPRRPKAWDKAPNTWLDNYNITHVLKQYETTLPWFKFLGIFPIDFSAPDPYKKTEQPKCLYEETCSLNLRNEYNKGIRGIGMVFNLDPHYKGGSHWVGLYINLQNIEKPFVGYFDSYGYKTPDLIARLMRSFKLQIKTCELGYNARRFQYGGTECGMFSIYFIICMIHGISFKNFCKDSVSDKTMTDLRKILFSK